MKNRQGDLNLIAFYADMWRAAKVWAEDLLCATLRIAAPSNLLAVSDDSSTRSLPGTTWSYRTHDRSIDVFSDDGNLGIRFDLDSPDPSATQLQDFIRSQIEAGRDDNGRNDYFRILASDDFEPLASEAIATPRWHRATTLAHRAEMRAALHTDQPVVSLIKLVERWKVNGCSREEAKGRFYQLYDECVAFGSAIEEDAVGDVCALISGWCSPSADLFPKG